jgi:hypothetical protein
LIFVDDEMKVLSELPKLHEAADMMQVFPKGFPVQPHTGARVGAQRSGRAGHISVATHVHVLGSRALAWRQIASRKVFAKRNAKALKFEL